MPKKPSVSIPFIVVIRTIVFLLIGLLLFSTYSNLVNFLTTSNLFAVKDVLIDTSIQFINLDELRSLKGRNIFKVDIGRVHTRLSAEYPQIADLNVVRLFPDKIKVLAKKRDPLAQLRLKSGLLLVDTEGVALYNMTESQSAFPIISGIVLGPRVVLGASVPSRLLHSMVQVLNQCKSNAHTARLKIITVDAANSSKIILTLEGGLQVILDQDKIPLKIQKFDTLLAQGKIDWTQARYVDLRFDEPIIAAGDEGKDN